MGEQGPVGYDGRPGQTGKIRPKNMLFCILLEAFHSNALHISTIRS